MQNPFTKAVAVCGVLLAFTSCKKDETQARIELGSAPVLTASTNTVVLTQANAANTAVTYTWTPAASPTWQNVEHPYKVGLTYQLQIDKKGGSFTAPYNINASTSPVNVSQADLSGALISLGLAPGVASQVDVRLNTTYAPNTSQASPVVTLTATPYKVCVPPNSDTWAIIGPAGVDWNTDVPLTYDCDAKAYVARVALKAGDFKFRQNKDWPVNLGALSKPLTPGATATPLKRDGDDMTITTPGTYTVKLVVDGSGSGVAGGTLTVTP